MIWQWISLKRSIEILGKLKKVSKTFLCSVYIHQYHIKWHITWKLNFLATQWHLICSDMLNIMDVRKEFATPTFIMILTSIILNALNACNSGSRAHSFIKLVAKYMFLGTIYPTVFIKITSGHLKCENRRWLPKWLANAKKLP